MKRGLLIGEVAARSGLSRKAVRLYEARGILPRPSRTASGYRVYDPAALGTLRFIAMARQLGLTLTEIRQIVSMRRSGVIPPSVSARTRTSSYSRKTNGTS